MVYRPSTSLTHPRSAFKALGSATTMLMQSTCACTYACMREWMQTLFHSCTGFQCVKGVHSLVQFGVKLSLKLSWIDFVKGWWLQICWAADSRLGFQDVSTCWTGFHPHPVCVYVRVCWPWQLFVSLIFLLVASPREWPPSKSNCANPLNSCLLHVIIF